MSPDDEPLTVAQKLKALRQIQFVLGHTEQPLARACGLNQNELATLANEELIEVYIVEDTGPDLDRFLIAGILPGGYAILALGHTEAPEKISVDVVPRQKSLGTRIFEGTRSGLWDLIKVAVAAVIGAVVGWHLKKHFGP